MKEGQSILEQRINELLGDISLREIKEKRNGLLKYPVSFSKDFIHADITEMELSVRSHNCLKRAGIYTVEDLVERINGREDLLKFKNLGSRSADEIMTKLFLFHFSKVKTEKQPAYIERVKHMNQ